MHFASSVPLWLAAAAVAAAAGLAFWTYRRPLAPLTAAQRGLLIALRALALAAVVCFLCRPVVVMPTAVSGAAVVPVLVDVSRSMRIADADGQSRLARATALLTSSVLPSLSKAFTVELYGAGDRLAPASADALHPDARQTDLVGALAAVRDRYRGRPVPGIVLLSDGGDTGQQAPSAAGGGPPVFAVGVGSPDGVPDREVVGVSAGDPRLDQASVDLHVTTVSRGFGRAPFQLQLLANGQTVDTRRVVPAADGSPIEDVFTVSPDPINPTVYAATIAAEPTEAIPENNTRSVLVSPAGRTRRLLVLEGQPGFEHSFLTRALSHDTGLDVDTVVRTGKNEKGEDTFFVQAGRGRAASLTTGFPATREALYAYDGLIVANVEGDFFTRAQLATMADFVSERGGGLLVLGGRSFAEHGLIGTPLEEALPVELSDRRGGLVRTSYSGAGAAAVTADGPHNTVVLTADGETHPVMRIGASPDESRKRWAGLPPLAASAPLGGPRPGATVLAVTSVPGGAVYPVVAVQRFGRGRSMVFAGEGSWRWRMMLASTDRSYEYFWRQAARWLAGPAPDPVTVTAPESAEAGDAIEVGVDVRDAAFAPAADADLTATLTVPGGDSRPLTLRRQAGAAGRFQATVPADLAGRAGLYRVHARATRGGQSLGEADRWFSVGGGQREFADPRLNEAALRRLARASGGRYLRPAEASRLASLIEAAVPPDAPPQTRDLWHEPWAYALLIALLSAEWILRRRWGLR